jgi:hypothetical protein
VAAWLAEPAPSGALGFVSPEAVFAVAGLTRRPEAMFDDIARTIRTEDGDGALAELAEAEAKLGFSLRDDLAASLGGDWAVALDGPWLPEPAWKLVAEVRDAGRLEQVLARLAEAASVEAEAAGRPGFRFEQEEVDGRRYLHLAQEGGADLAYLTFVDGYLVAAPSRALIVDAIARRESGTSLASSQAFLDRLPRDAEPDYSAVAWENLGATAESIAGLLGPAAGGADAAALEQLTGGEPTLVVAYGESDRIRLVALGAAGPLGFSFERWLALAGLFAPEAGAEAEADETPVRTAA